MLLTKFGLLKGHCFFILSHEVLQPNMNKAKPILRARNQSPFISLVIPVYNESDAVPLFIQSIKKIFGENNLRYEMVFVNDGSSDSTLSILVDESRSNPHIRIINLSRNFRKEAALTAGFNYVKGDVVVPMDVDLQDPPEVIISFLDYWREGFDVVCGVRVSRKSDGSLKRLTAALFYRIFNIVSPESLPENVGDFRLMDRNVVNALKLFPERNRFMKGIFALAGFSTKEITYERPERIAGTTKWNYWRLWNFALDGVVGFSTLPLRIWLYLGVCISLSSFLYASFIFFRAIILGIDVPGYASLMTVMLFLGGIQVLSFGVMGEYIARLFIEVKQRPIYIVQGVYEGGEFKPGNYS